MTTKPIQGTWFEFRHNSEAEGKYWNDACQAFSAEQWREKVREMAELGMEYCVLMGIAWGRGEAFYASEIFPRFPMACQDPLDAVLSEADRWGIKFFISNDYFGQWDSFDHLLRDPAMVRTRSSAMEEVAERYGHHPSFYGWYWPNEACINPLYTEDFIAYVNECSAVAHDLTPRAKTLIAPYGTAIVDPNDAYARQLERLDVDIIAYQDEVGVRKATSDQTGAFFAGLRRAHDRVGRSRIWADVELFDFEGDVYRSALIPSHMGRFEKQLEAVSPHVDVLLVYQYLGIMNRPGTIAFAGREDSTAYHEAYRSWLERNHPHMLKQTAAM